MPTNHCLRYTPRDRMTCPPWMKIPSMGNAERAWTRDELRTDVLEILSAKSKKLDSDFSGPLTEETRIVGDLDFESVILVEFCMAIGKHFRKKLPFQNLVLQNGQFQDFTVGELVTFLEEHCAPEQGVGEQLG